MKSSEATGTLTPCSTRPNSRPNGVTPSRANAHHIRPTETYVLSVQLRMMRRMTTSKTIVPFSLPVAWRMMRAGGKVKGLLLTTAVRSWMPYEMAMATATEVIEPVAMYANMPSGTLRLGRGVSSAMCVIASGVPMVKAPG